MNIINDIIYPVLEKFKEDEELDFELTEDLELYGYRSVFDSLSVVCFAVNIQDRVLENYGKKIILVSDEALSMSNSPFETVKSLSNYIEELISNA